jgi:hypothetical protein
MDVARATAKIADESLSNVLLSRIRILVQQVADGEYMAGYAEAALKAVAFPQRLLQLVEAAVRRITLDSDNIRMVDACREDETGLGDSPVDSHRTRTAVAVVATNVGAREPNSLTDDIDEKLAIFDRDPPGAGVDRKGDRATWSLGAIRSRIDDVSSACHDAFSWSSARARRATTAAMEAR